MLGHLSCMDDSNVQTLLPHWCANKYWRNKLFHTTPCCFLQCHFKWNVTASQDSKTIHTSTEGSESSAPSRFTLKLATLQTITRSQFQCQVWRLLKRKAKIDEIMSKTKRLLFWRVHGIEMNTIDLFNVWADIQQSFTQCILYAHELNNLKPLSHVVPCKLPGTCHSHMLLVTYQHCVSPL